MLQENAEVIFTGEEVLAAFFLIRLCFQSMLELQCVLNAALDSHIYLKEQMEAEEDAELLL